MECEFKRLSSVWGLSRGEGEEKNVGEKKIYVISSGYVILKNQFFRPQRGRMGIGFLPDEILVWRPDYIVYYRKSHFPNKALNDCESRVVDGNIAELDFIWLGFLQ